MSEEWEESEPWCCLRAFSLSPTACLPGHLSSTASGSGGNPSVHASIIPCWNWRSQQTGRAALGGRTPEAGPPGGEAPRLFTAALYTSMAGHHRMKCECGQPCPVLQAQVEHRGRCRGPKPPEPIHQQDSLLVGWGHPSPKPSFTSLQPPQGAEQSGTERRQLQPQHQRKR